MKSTRYVYKLLRKKGKLPFRVRRPLILDMKPLTPREFLETAEATRNLSDVFGCEDTTEQLKHFLNHYCDLKDLDPPAYYWPTEKDPHTAEVLQWQEQNLAHLLPSVCESCARD
jgi:hypothetical protein